MSESQRKEESSMEEVLASIRRAIEEEAEGRAAPSDELPQDPPRDRDNVIQLTQMVTPDGKVVDLRREKQMRDAMQAIEAEIAEEGTPTAPPAQPEPAQENLGAVDPFKAAGAAAITKFLTQHPEQPIEQGPRMGDGRSLEEVVRQALVPHVREWLEANLNPLVQNIVREEIEQIVRRRKDE